MDHTIYLDKKIKCFVIDDTPLITEMMKRLIEEDEKCKLEFAGSATNNPINLISILQEKEVDIVIVDLVLATSPDSDEVLKNKETSGIEAIKDIRQYLGNDIKIIAHSIYPQYRQKTIDAGADLYLLKEIPVDEICTIIYSTFYNINNTYKMYWLTNITKIIIYKNTKKLEIQDNEKKSDLITISNSAFSLLIYLIEERIRDEHDWIIKKEQGNKYVIQNKNMWYNICQDYNSIGNNDILYSYDLSKWANEINSKVLQYMYDSRYKIIDVPGRGKAAINSVYTLSRFLNKEKIQIL